MMAGQDHLLNEMRGGFINLANDQTMSSIDIAQPRI